MARSERPKAPAWLSTKGSTKARRTSARTAPAPTAARGNARTPTRARGVDTPVQLADNARVVLERRYLGKDDRGHVVETPEQLVRRVAKTIAAVEKTYGATTASVSAIEATFYDLIATMTFLPNSPTLGNAGRPLQQLAACFVLPVEDSMTGIFESLKDTALIHQSGGGTGFAFSRLRPAGDIVSSTGGIASGPVSFMRVFDAATESIKQGGTRRGANMAILNVEHPDIEAFINVKSDMTTLQNFNISVAVTEKFMKAVERDEEYVLTNPRTGARVTKKRARDIFRQIIANAWKNGDPGLVFIDRINRDNPTPALGAIEATNPCGEQPLLPYESCNLGSINLSKFVGAPGVPANGASQRQTANSKQQGAGAQRETNGRNPRAIRRLAANGRRSESEGAAFDWDRLAETIPHCVRFLDNVIDANRYPIPQIEEMTKQTRKIGLGVMGWADVLFKLGIPYDSEEAVALGGRVMAYIQEHADRASEALARERGTFPAWKGSAYARKRRLRNATRTTVAPTGTLSIIADCSGGIEPAFALAFMRQHFLDRRDPSKVTRLPEVNASFRAAAEEHGFYSDGLMRHLADGGSLAARDDVPAWAKRVFVTSHDIAPEWHVRMQAAFQRHTDNAVSKTINFRSEATVEDVEAAYMLAYREGCKGITVYRDGSRDQQVLSHATARGPEQAEAAAAEIALRFADVLPSGVPVLPSGTHPEAHGSLAPRPPGAPYRRHLPDERRSVTHKFRVGDQEGYVTVGLYDDGMPGEIFVNISKEGSTIRGLMDSVAVLTSVSLQYGVPLRNLVEKFRGVHFEPAGMTSNPQVPTASSLVDYIFRWLEVRFLGAPVEEEKTTEKASRSKGKAAGKKASKAPTRAPGMRAAARVSDGATSTGIGCPECGAILYFSEGCFVCKSCGYTRC
jgi:ribonucleoside-diphosphate reductase alpha chain